MKDLLDLVSLRKGKLEVAVMLHARTVDGHNFVNVMQSLNSEADRQAVLVICGHVDSGKSTTTGRLLFELGGIPEREMQKLKEEVKTTPQTLSTL